MTYFVTSDIHGYYKELIAALDKAGFDKDNPDHCLITCGDHFDRGPEPLKVMKYLMSLPRKVLIRGNHEYLFEELCSRKWIYSYDITNGTAQTIADLVGGKKIPGMFDIALEKTKEFFDSMVNYYETKNYIFVHSWIPTIVQDFLPAYYTRERIVSWKTDWRKATQKEWNEAMWGDPFDMAAKGLNKTGKTIVFGHWHCSTGWSRFEGVPQYSKWEPYYGETFIAIDRCTAMTGEVNVIKIEDEVE
jgi:predicted phosphodiesterase